MKRNQDWQRDLSVYLHGLKEAEPVPMPCVMFAAGAVMAMTGVDLASGFRACKTEAEGMAKLDELGFADHVSYVASLLPTVAKPQPGDVVILTEDAVGIFAGRGWVYAMGINGRPGLRTAQDVKKAFGV